MRWSAICAPRPPTGWKLAGFALSWNIGRNLPEAPPPARHGCARCALVLREAVSNALRHFGRHHAANRGRDRACAFRPDAGAEHCRMMVRGLMASCRAAGAVLATCSGGSRLWAARWWSRPGRMARGSQRPLPL